MKMRTDLSFPGMPKRFIITSAINDYYFPLLLDLLRSLRDCRLSFDFDIGLLDVGLNEQNRRLAGAFDVAIKAPGVDIDYPDRVRWEQKATYFRAMTSRPFLPDYFPGYEAYMWIDADAWVQTPEALEVMLPAAAKDQNLYIASEFDVAYPKALQGTSWNAWHNDYKNCFSADIAAAMCLRPFLNVGVFAMSAEAPHWRRWREILSTALGQFPEMTMKQFVLEQLSLNLLVYGDNMGAQIMPVEYNWVTINGLPAYDERAQLYVRPMPPHRPISILHLAAQIKNTSQIIRTTDGRTLERPLTYSVLLAEKNRRAS
jgi:hypothetical protein